MCISVAISVGFVRIILFRLRRESNGGFSVCWKTL
jgi:hypothetical protein